jgi:hypothetical protein
MLLFFGFSRRGSTGGQRRLIVEGKGFGVLQDMRQASGLCAFIKATCPFQPNGNSLAYTGEINNPRTKARRDLNATADLPHWLQLKHGTRATPADVR